MSIFVASPRIFNLTPRPARRKARRPRLPRPRPKSNPRAAWPDWTDQRWTIGPEVHTAADFAHVEGEGLHTADVIDVIVRSVMDDLIVRESAPTAGPDYVPSPEAIVSHDAYQHGYDHDEDAVPDSELSPDLAAAWWRARNRGYLARLRDDAEARWAEDIEADRRFTERQMEGWEPAEIVEAAGALVLRGGVA